MLRIHKREFFAIRPATVPEMGNIARSIRLLLLCSTLLTANVFLFAQPAISHDYAFGRLSVTSGLPQATVQCILQDREGFLWIGTQGGLARYDGYSFRNYKHLPRDANSISHNWINSICEDRSGRLWIATDGGVNIFDKTTEYFHKFSTLYQQPGAGDNSILSILESRDGTLLIGTAEEGMLQFQPKNGQLRKYRHNPQDSLSLSHNAVSTLLESAAGQIWIGTWGGGLNKFDQATGTFVSYAAANDDSGPANNWIRDIVEGREDTLWIATEKGLSCLSQKENRFGHFDRGSGLSSDNVWSLMKDQAGTLWVGTLGGGLHYRASKNRFVKAGSLLQQADQFEGDIFSTFQDYAGRIWAGSRDGLLFLEQSEKKFHHYSTKANSRETLSNPSVWTFCEDVSGIIWIGTLDGLNAFDPRQKTFTTYRQEPGVATSLSNNSIWAVFNDSKGNLWVGTRNGLNYKKAGQEQFRHYFSRSGDTTSLSHNWVVDIQEDHSGNLWIATWGGGLNRLDPQSGRFQRFRSHPGDHSTLSHNGVWTLLEDATGTLWVGTEDGLNRFNAADNSFTCYRIGDLPQSGDHWITAIFEDGENRLWVGTETGLRQFDRQTATFLAPPESQGLPGDVVHGIQQDNSGKLWFSTNQGIYQFDPLSSQVKHYDVLDGLQSNEFNGGAVLKSASGHLYFGGIDGFNVFHPDSISGNTYVPNIVISSLKRYDLGESQDEPLEEAGIALRRRVDLDYQDKILNFQFAALNFRNSDKNQYSYRLEGFNDQWIQLGNRREATFTNLDPGYYTLRVRGSNNDGLWNKTGASLDIYIAPPWWQTWWFRLLAIAAIAAVVTVAHKRRQANLRIRTELNAAREAQLSIMPGNDPDVPGLDISGVCIPAMEVGGDFFDYLWIGENREKFAIAVGDVSGKGMKAAMTAVMSSGMLHAKSMGASSVKEILNLINKPIFSKTAKTMFTALLLVAIDLQKRQITFTNAGLAEPLLKSASGTEYLASTGMKFPLGGMESMVYSETSATLSAGDVLILYSDGVPEAQDSSGEFYEIDRLRDFIANLHTGSLSAAEIKKQLLDDINKFVGNAPQHDDITIVVARVK